MALFDRARLAQVLQNGVTDLKLEMTEEQQAR